MGITVSCVNKTTRTSSSLGPLKKYLHPLVNDVLENWVTSPDLVCCVTVCGECAV